MNTVELSKDLAGATGLPAARAENIVKYLFARIGKCLADGETVKLHQFNNKTIENE
jgi:nucleoid DNA-binding protein